MHEIPEIVEKSKLTPRMAFIVQMQSDHENPALDRAGRLRALEMLRDLGEPVGATRQPDPRGGKLQFWEWREARDIRTRIIEQRNAARANESPPRPPLPFPIEDPEIQRLRPPPSAPWEDSLRA